MKTIVVYTSQTGFTKRYAQWIAEDLGCEAVTVDEAARLDINAYDVVVFGGWEHAGGLAGKKWLKQMHATHAQTPLIAFVVGATPADWVDTVDEFLSREFAAPELCDVEHFYLQGGFDYDRLNLPNKLAMKMFFKMQEKQAENDPRAAEMLSGMREGFDATDRTAIEPLVSRVRTIAAEGTPANATNATNATNA